LEDKRDIICQDYGTLLEECNKEDEEEDEEEDEGMRLD
jgi:hypothetical protein